MSVDDARETLAAHPRLARLLGTLSEVGLGYLRLGQSAATLSGGEAQRVKLARELGRRETGRTLYLLDEPTTGLHVDDVRRLLDVLGRLVDAGNTVVVIEHNLDVVKCADWVIDLGPEAGDGGGRVVAAGHAGDGGPLAPEPHRAVPPAGPRPPSPPPPLRETVARVWLHDHARARERGRGATAGDPPWRIKSMKRNIVMPVGGMASLLL